MELARGTYDCHYLSSRPEEIGKVGSIGGEKDEENGKGEKEGLNEDTSRTNYAACDFNKLPTTPNCSVRNLIQKLLPSEPSPIVHTRKGI